MDTASDERAAHCAMVLNVRTVNMDPSPGPDHGPTRPHLDGAASRLGPIGALHRAGEWAGQNFDKFGQNFDPGKNYFFNRLQEIFF